MALSERINQVAQESGYQSAIFSTDGSALLGRTDIRNNFDDAERRRELLRSLIACRKQLGLSQKEVAKKMGTTQSAVSDLEGGVSDPRLSTIQRYARSVDDFIVVHLGETVVLSFRDTYQTISNLEMNRAASTNSAVYATNGYEKLASVRSPERLPFQLSEAS